VGDADAVADAVAFGLAEAVALGFAVGGALGLSVGIALIVGRTSGTLAPMPPLFSQPLAVNRSAPAMRTNQ
jgi:hypothetical protein